MDLGLDYNMFTENPQYQKALRTAMQIPPALRALLPSSAVDAAYAGDAAKKNLELTKYGYARQLGEEKLANERLGLGAVKAYYDARTNAAENALDLAHNEAISSNVLGLANVGVSAYNANQNSNLNTLLSNYLTRKYNIG